MTLRSKALAVLAALALSYGVYPYVALYRLGAAVGAGDVAALTVLIDWDAVREAIKEEIAAAVRLFLRARYYRQCGGRERDP